MTFDVSVVIPCFNGENYLSDAIQSVLNQKGPKFEVLVVDDGSHEPERIQAICQSFGDDRVRYFYKPNGGVASALNFGLKNAKAEIFCWLSHDDLFSKNRLKIQWSHWSTLTSKKTLIFGNFNVFGPEAEFKGIVRFDDLAISQSPVEVVSRGLINGCTVMARVSDIAAAGYFDEELLATQDYDMWLKLAAGGVDFVHVPQVLCHTRVHALQGSKTQTGVMQENQVLWAKIATVLQLEKMRISPSVAVRSLRELYDFVQSSEYLNSYDVRPILDEISNLVQKTLQEYSVAVIMPTRGLAWETTRAIRSVFAQSHKNLRLIVVNDSGTTLPSQILGELDKSQVLVKVINNKLQMGPATSRNAGIAEVSRADFVAFLDSDDEFLSTKISSQVEHMVKNTLDFSHTDYLLKETFLGKTISKIVSTDDMQNPGLLFRIANTGSTIATPTVMFRTSLLGHLSAKKRTEIFPAGESVGEDAVAWVRLIDAASDKVGYLPEPLTLVNANSRSSKNLTLNRQIAIELLSAELREMGMPSALGLTQPAIFRGTEKRVAAKNLKEFLYALSRVSVLRRIYNWLSGFAWFREVFTWILKRIL